MRKLNLLILSMILLGSVLLNAQASRTWVSGVGDDANPCSRTAPCKTFAGAISKTAPGGEIDALDPGGFGALTITKAITIDGGGGQVASVLVSGTNGIVVQAGASDVVILRHLRINGIGTGINGIRWLAGKELHIENCFIFGFNNNAVDIAKNDGGKAFVINTFTENNANAGLQSINTTSTVSIVVDGSHFGGSVLGVKAGDNTSMTVRNSESSGNQFGFAAVGNAGLTEINVVGSTAANDTSSGVFAGGGATLATARISGNSFFNDGTGITVSTNGAVNSANNNTNASGLSGALGGLTVQ